MARLSFSGNISLDGFMNDADGNFDWSEPSEEVHQFWNDFEQQNGTFIYGRRLYETMVFWETMPPDDSPIMNEYADIWRRADKVVVSSSLQDVASERTTLVRSLDLDYVRELKATSAHDITIGGPTLAAQAMDVVDDIHVLVYPVVVGAGTRFFGPTPASFELAESRVFGNGVVHLHYRRAD